METLIGLKDLRLHMDKYATEVSAGKTFTVLKQNKPVFKITPVDAPSEEWEEVINFAKIKKGGVNIDELLAIL
jgi:antitoxin (DNA-binding transcriptional repressor) of toxin-antitoxin stability system